PDPGRKPQGCGRLFKRVPGDTIASVGLSDIDGKLKGGPIMLYAGWQLNGQPYGAPNDGYLPVPGALLCRLIANPDESEMFWPEPSGEGHNPKEKQKVASHASSLSGRQPASSGHAPCLTAGETKENTDGA